MNRFLQYIMTKVVIAMILVAPQAIWAAQDPDAGIKLFNGEDLSGWKAVTEDESVPMDKVWSVRDGVIVCSGEPIGYLRTEKEYENYSFRFEWRWVGEPGNSGLLLHTSTEDKVWPVCIQGQLKHEHAGDLILIKTAIEGHSNPDEGIIAVERIGDPNEKPAGEWNEMTALCQGDSIKIVVNGMLQNEATSASVTKGAIGLQAEGGAIEFRNIVLVPMGQ